jgi:formylglycine-generating enzyme required for sulfatase activity
MKKNITIILLAFILASCVGQTEAPSAISTSTSIPTLALTEIIASPVSETVLPTITPTEELTNQRTSPIDGMPQVYIPAGMFHMGGYDVRAAPDEFPAHEVTLSAFWMDQLEVTNVMYALCVGAGACALPQSLESQRQTDYFNNPEFKDYPVVYVTWGDANTYCEWAGRRLPTEAEWERAARGDDLRTFPWGEDKPDYRFANFNFIVKDTSRVGSYPLGASPFGVLDMAGNVAEWTVDFYKSNFYEASNSINPIASTGSNFFRVVRGGSLGDAEINIRAPKRSSVLGSNLNAIPGSPKYLGEFSPRIGFRCAESE